MTMTITHTLPEETWRRFVDQHPQGNIFHTPEMFQVFSESQNHTPSLWAVVDSCQNPLVLFLPVHVYLFLGPLRWFSTRSVSYGGILCEEGTQGKVALEKLLRAYIKSNQKFVLFTEMRNRSDLSEFQMIFSGCGFQYKEEDNYLINLANNPEAIFQKFGRRTRKNIRQGLRKKKIIIREADSMEEVSICYELLKKTFVHARIHLAHKSLFEKAYNLLKPKGMVKFLLAEVDNNFAATSIELIYKHMVFGWYGGMDRAYTKFIPNDLLMWHILKWGSENGYRVYDFGGAGKPDEAYGVRDFKAKFGGHLVRYGRNTCVHSLLKLCLGRLGYGVYRRLMLS